MTLLFYSEITLQPYISQRCLWSMKIKIPCLLPCCKQFICKELCQCFTKILLPPWVYAYSLHIFAKSLLRQYNTKAILFYVPMSIKYISKYLSCNYNVGQSERPVFRIYYEYILIFRTQDINKAFRRTSYTNSIYTLCPGVVSFQEVPLSLPIYF